MSGRVHQQKEVNQKQSFLSFLPKPSLKINSSNILLQKNLKLKQDVLSSMKFDQKD